MSKRPKHPLEDFTRDTFGEQFAAIILHGLNGEEAKDVCLSFERVDEWGTPVQTTLSIIKPSSEPCGFKPLILAAVFKLLLNRPERKQDFVFFFKEVLEELIWPDTSACRREVDDAINYYLRCCYERRDVAKEVDVSRGSYQLLINYEYERAFHPLRDRFVDDGSTITLNMDLIKPLQEGLIAFAGISFGKLARGDNGSSSGVSINPTTVARQQSGAISQTEYDLVTQYFPPPARRPTIQIDATPVFSRGDDTMSAILARPEGHIDIAIDTGAMAATVLRALQHVATQNPSPNDPVYESNELVAEYVFRELDRLIKPAVYQMHRQLRRQVFFNSLRYSYELRHAQSPSRSPGQRGLKSKWQSPHQFISAFWRAIEAIEFDGWKPRSQRVTLNRAWDIENVRVATSKLVIAYWSEMEGRQLGQVDSSRMSKWLKSLGLRKFSEVRDELRRSITTTRANQSLLNEYKGNLWALMTFNPTLYLGYPASNKSAED